MYTPYATICTSLVLARPRKYEMNSRKLKIKTNYLYHSYMHEMKTKVSHHNLEWIHFNKGICYISLLFYYSIDHDVQINCSTWLGIMKRYHLHSVYEWLILVASSQPVNITNITNITNTKKYLVLSTQSRKCRLVLTKSDLSTPWVTLEWAFQLLLIQGSPQHIQEEPQSIKYLKRTGSIHSSTNITQTTRLVKDTWRLYS